MSTAFVTMTPENGAPQFVLRNSLVGSMHIDLLENRDQPEVLAFLSNRPLHTIYMTGLISDNGMVSPLNRGAFYAYRGSKGKLEGVALLGEKTLLESHSEGAFVSLTTLASANPDLKLIRGEKSQVDRMLESFAGLGREPRLVCRELLFEQRSVHPDINRFSDLRPATLAELKQVIAINSMMIFEENGVNPLERDATGVCERIARRIQQGREWVHVSGGRVIFKASVISEAPECTFVEGVYVHPEERGRGYAYRYLSELGHNLLARAPSICLVVNESNSKALALYRKANYQLLSHYRTAYF